MPGRLAELEAANQKLALKCAELERTANAARTEWQQHITEFNTLKAFHQGYKHAEERLTAERDLALDRAANLEAELREIKEFLNELHRTWYEQAPDYIREIDTFLKPRSDEYRSSLPRK